MCYLMLLAAESARQDARLIFYSLLLSWVYENGFTNFYQGFSPWKNLKIKLVVGVRFAEFSHSSCHRLSANRWSNLVRHCNAMPVGTSGREVTKAGRSDISEAAVSIPTAGPGGFQPLPAYKMYLPDAVYQPLIFRRCSKF
jgi:hypothetical protein